MDAATRPRQRDWQTGTAARQSILSYASQYGELASQALLSCKPARRCDGADRRPAELHAEYSVVDQGPVGGTRGWEGEGREHGEGGDGRD